MSLSENLLANVSTLSAELAEAELSDDPTRLAAMVAACRTIEQRALTLLSGRVSQADMLQAQQDALSALGW